MPTLLFLAGLASASAAEGDDLGLTLTAHVGPDIPLSPLGVFILPGVQVGWVLPPADGLLEIFGLGAYSAPLAQGTGQAPGFDQPFDWEVRQKQVTIGLGGRLRFRELAGPLGVTVAAGPKLDLNETVTRGTLADGTDLGEHREQYTTGGFHAAAGIEVAAGPGAFLAEAAFLWAPLTHVITGQSHAGRLVPQIGYRLML